ncbi:putative methyltransferase-like protein [Lyngbya aestuarii BL J]|uniref:Putative methyltransferase-like protein n=1 Tax=Lyngbya aestuarii BL J TaxID=1348334 RepID=U7QDX9_9CYAN|nr:putative methyltransferase-like protein [Lyngbya aestuarii BL J]
MGAGLRFNSGTSNPDSSLGVNELFVQQALVDCLKLGDIFLDIDAHVGFFTKLGRSDSTLERLLRWRQMAGEKCDRYA